MVILLRDTKIGTQLLAIFDKLQSSCRTWKLAGDNHRCWVHRILDMVAEAFQVGVSSCWSGSPETRGAQLTSPTGMISRSNLVHSCEARFDS